MIEDPEIRSDNGIVLEQNESKQGFHAGQAELEYLKIKLFNYFNLNT